MDLSGAGLGDLLTVVDVALMVQGDGLVPRRLVIDGVDVSRAAVLPAPLGELVVTDLPREFGGVVALGTHVLRKVDGEDVVTCNVVGCLGGEGLVPKSHQGFNDACDQHFEVCCKRQSDGKSALNVSLEWLLSYRSSSMRAWEGCPSTKFRMCWT